MGSENWSLPTVLQAGGRAHGEPVDRLLAPGQVSGPRLALPITRDVSGQRTSSPCTPVSFCAEGESMPTLLGDGTWQLRG